MNDIDRRSDTVGAELLDAISAQLTNRDLSPAELRVLAEAYALVNGGLSSVTHLHLTS